MNPTMLGVGRAKLRVASFLEANLPPLLDVLRVAWELDEEQLKPPVAYLPTEPRALDRWPLVAVTGTRLARLRRTDHDGEDTEYQATYNLRLYSWVNVTGYEEAVVERDYLTAAIRHLLLDRPTLGTDGSTVLEETSIVEDYSEVAPVKGDRFVAGSVIAFDLRIAETVTREPSGTVAVADAVVERLEPV